MILFNTPKSDTFGWPRFRVKAKAVVRTWIRAWAGVGTCGFICARTLADIGDK
jgi:hypothetical protein